jgi:hypothetical protein
MINVLLLSPDFHGTGSDTSLITGIFASFGDCNTSIYNTVLGDPTVDDLLAYDVVMVGNNWTWASSGGCTAEGVGNALADYIDAGGKVIESNFVRDWMGPPPPSKPYWYLKGRYITGGYGPFLMATTDQAGPLAFTIVNGSHPVMAGVASVQDPSDFMLNVGLQTGATSLAIWDADPEYQAIAVSADSAVVGLNMALFDGSQVTGNIGALLHNSVLWLAGY